MSKIIRYTVDLNNPPPLSEEVLAEIAALKAQPDREIDTSDIPELTEKFWQNAVPNPYFRPVKRQLTLRIDADLIEWFKRKSADQRGYQTRINRALRDYVEREEQAAAQSAAE